MKKRILSMVLAIAMVAGMLPTAAFAAEGDNLCDHHTEHTADCGYAPAVEGSPCTHECGEECAEACAHAHDALCGYVEAAAEVPCGYVCEESHGEATRVIYVDESTFFASGYSRFYDANENLLTATREEQEDGWVKYTMPADAKYYLTFDGHMGGGGGGNYPELPTNADTYDPFSDTWSCSHPGYAEGNCTLCGEPCPGHTYDNACDDKCNVCSEIREVGDHVYDGAEDAECNECSYVRDITPVQITGVSITVDGVLYTEGNVTITPDSTVILTVTGTSLHSGSDDHTVDYANGLYLYVNPDYFEISEDGTTATYAPSAGDFAKSSNFEITYCNNDTDTANRTVVPTGIYLTYDDGIAEEDKARITGMSITIDGVVYDSGNTSAEDPAVITPNTGFITITVHGTALQNCTTDHVVSYYSGSSEPILPNSLWRFEADGTGAYHHYSSASALSDFARNTTPYELQYSNNGSFNAANPAIGSGVYIVYDDSTGGEEDTTPAEITGVSITVDGVEYTEGNVTITPDSTVTLTVTGTNLQNGTEDNMVEYADGISLLVAPGGFESSEDGTTAIYAPPAGRFANSSNFEIKYYNNYTDTDNRSAVYTGIYLTYDDGIAEEDQARITGVSITVDDVEYTSGNVTITPTSTVVYTVTGENFANIGEGTNLAVFYGDGSIPVNSNYCWIIDTEANTATCDLSAYIDWFEGCNNSESRYSNDGSQSWTNTGIYLTYDDGSGDDNTGGEEDTTPAEITGVSITVDGVEYTEGEVTITPDTQSIIYTVTGTHFANLSENNKLSFAHGEGISVAPGYGWSIDTEANTATLDCSQRLSWFESCNNFEVNYRNDGGTTEIGTGIYLTYDDSTGGEEDTTPAEITGVSITVDGVEHTEGNVTITPETESIIVTVTGTHFANLSDANILDLGPGLTIFMDSWRWEIDSAANTATADFSDINSEFGDHNGIEIMYSNDSNQNWTGTGIYLTYDDGTGGEEDTTPAEITGVSITVDGETYTSGNVAITPDSTVTLTVTGTNLQNGTDDNRVDYANGAAVIVSRDYCEISEDGTTATRTLSAANFAQSVNYEVIYSNNYIDPAIRTEVPTGIYVTYDDGIEVNTTLAIGDNEIADGYTYTYTAEQDGSLYITVTELYYRGIGEVSEDNLSYWCAIEINGTAITEFANSTEVKTGDTVTVELISLDNDTYNGTVNLSWDASVMAEITGVSIVIDGEEYVGSDTSAENPAVISSESASVILTVHGANLQNATGDQWVSYMPTGNCVTLDNSDWTKSEDGSLASLDLTFLTESFIQSVSVWEIKYSSNGGNLEDAVTGLYVKYEHIAGEEEPIVIIQQPTDGEAKLGERYCVEVIAQGDGLTYQWYFKNAGSEQWHKSGVTDNTYDDVMTTARAGREVYCVITDADGNSVTTETAKLIAVKTAELVITQQPNDSSAKLDEMFCVEVLAQGDGLKYQWYWRQIGDENWTVSGQRDNTYDDVMTSARHNREVYCVITDAWGDSVTTEIATITGTPTTTLEITRQPESQSVTIGDMFNVTFEAQGDGLKYQWYFKNSGTDVWHVSGQRDNSYDDVMTKARHDRSLYCVVTDAWGNTVTTEPVVVIMATPRHELAITAQPENDSAKLGEDFCVTVEAQGDELRYQWYWRQVGTETWHVSGQRDNTYDDVMTKARHNREVKCVITDMWGESVETEIATIIGTPTAELTITTQPTDGEAVMGEGYCVTVEAVGDGLTYQWYFKNAGSDVWHMSGVKDNTYDDIMTKARAGRQVYCVITDAWGNTVTTETANLIAK